MTDKPEPTKAPAVIAKHGNEVAVQRAALSLRDYLLDRADAQEPDMGDLHTVTAEMLEKMLQATSLEEIMSADQGSTFETRDIVGARLRIIPQALRVARSYDEFDSPLGVYVQFKAIVLEDYENGFLVKGAEILVSSGAPLVIGKLRVLEANSFFPVDVLIASTRTPKGSVVKLQSLPSPKVAAK